MGNRLNCGKQVVGCAADCAKGTMDDYPNEDLFDDQFCCCDPAGAIFEETLGNLNDMDRQLLLFSTGANLAAVRWIFVLGGSVYASDANKTSCLHTSCRTGSLTVARELVRRGAPLDTQDVGGWTALHIAVFMSRRDIVLELLQSGADLKKRNNKGLLPFDLSNDAWMREASIAYQQHLERRPGQRWYYERDPLAGGNMDSTLSSVGMRYDPFFVPRSAVITEAEVHKSEYRALGQQIFDKRPGQGLAFLVATGCSRDYPVDLSAYLRRQKVDLGQIGSFLGEAFSLAQTLRLEFINSTRFQGTTIVSSLSKVFSLLQVPPDLQKVDRLVRDIARIWWRQHENLEEDEKKHCVNHHASNSVRAQQDFVEVDAAQHDKSDHTDLEGFELKQYLVSPEALYQLMFSVVMLHWNLYAPSTAKQKPDHRMSLPQWLELNKGLESDGSDVPSHVLRRTFHTVSRGFLPQLAIRGPGPSDDKAEGKGVFPSASLEGWVRLIGHGFPVPSAAGSLTYGHISSVFSETTPSGRDGASAHSTVPMGHAERSRGWRGVVAQPALTTLDDPLQKVELGTGVNKAWLSLCHNILFFSTSPKDEAPYAFVHLTKTFIQHVDRVDFMVIVAGRPDDGNPWDANGFDQNFRDDFGDDIHSAGLCCPVKLLFLLPDGRWQDFEIARLVLQLQDMESMDNWASHLEAATGISRNAALGAVLEANELPLPYPHLSPPMG